MLLLSWRSTDRLHWYICGGWKSIWFAVRNSKVPTAPARTPLPGVLVSGRKNTGLPSAATLVKERTSACTVLVSE